MSIRDISYTDYGIDDTELKELLIQIRTDDKAQDLFLECCRKVRPDLANDIYYSFTGKVSYDDLMMIKRVPMTRVDFYGYRRKAVAIFKDMKKELVNA